jgi:hypothetical protein
MKMETNILETDAKIKSLVYPQEQRLVPFDLASFELPHFTTWFVRALATRYFPSDNYSFYLIETIALLKKYEEELRKPIPVQFHRKKGVETQTELGLLAQQYFYVLSRLACRFDFLLGGVLSPTKKKLICLCHTAELILEDNDFFTCCKLCGERFELGHIAFNYGDSKRLVLSQKNPSDKKHHFSDCIDKWQGIQKETYPPQLFEEMEAQLKTYNLVDTAGTTRAQRFAKVTKDHVKLILKNMGVYKQYKEHLNVLFKILTEKALPEINHLKQRLLHDFEVFDQTYCRIFSGAERTAYHYNLILYQLLCMYGYPCSSADFSLLKTMDRKSQHDANYARTFAALNWGYRRLF